MGWLANEVSLAWIHERVPRETAPLPDLWFSFFPEVPLFQIEFPSRPYFQVTGAIRVTEYIMLILCVNAFIIIICHQHRWIVARRVFFCAGLAYLFRALCITIIQVGFWNRKWEGTTEMSPRVNENGTSLMTGRKVVATRDKLMGIQKGREKDLWMGNDEISIAFNVKRICPWLIKWLNDCHHFGPSRTSNSLATATSSIA